MNFCCPCEVMARSRHFFCVIWGPPQHWDHRCYSKHLGCLEKWGCCQSFVHFWLENPKVIFCRHLFSKSTGHFLVRHFLLRLFFYGFSEPGTEALNKTWSPQTSVSTAATQIERWNWTWYLFRWSRSQHLRFVWFGVAGLRFLGFPNREQRFTQRP